MSSTGTTLTKPQLRSHPAQKTAAEAHKERPKNDHDGTRPQRSVSPDHSTPFLTDAL